MEFNYGQDKLKFNIDQKRVTRILVANEKQGIKEPIKAVTDSLENPEGCDSLTKLVKEKNPEKIAIIVNDISRPTPYQYLLPPLLEKLHRVGIEKKQIIFIVATGIHKPHSDKQNREIYGVHIVDNYKILSHNPDRDLVDLSQLSSGNRLYLNKTVVEADFVIATGVILPHYFAGFSGGRKSVLPGVAGRDTIEYNHRYMVDLSGDLPPLHKNPVNQEMMEAARRINLDFIVNVVPNSNREIVEIVSGNYKKAWLKGVKTSASMYHVEIEEKVDVAIVSAGGYPRDINLYQAQKALDHADHAVKKGGTIILAAECPEGMGEEKFSEWINTATYPEDNVNRIREKFVLGGHKAYAISNVVLEKEFILVSCMDQQKTESLFARKKESIQQAINYVEEKYNHDYQAVIMPQGSLTVPVVKKPSGFEETG